MRVIVLVGKALIRHGGAGSADAKAHGNDYTGTAQRRQSPRNGGSRVESQSHLERSGASIWHPWGQAHQGAAASKDCS